MPFDVYIDKGALRRGKVKKAIAIIDTELTNWEYSVQAEFGTISNIGQDSFEYTRPKNEKQYEDTITVQFADKENKRIYQSVISLVFPISPEAVGPNIIST